MERDGATVQGNGQCSVTSGGADGCGRSSGCAGEASPQTFSSGVSCSLNRCCTWPCVVGACHNSGAAARTDPCWQAVLQAGGLRDEQGKPGVSPALRGLCGAVGTRQALQRCPRLILLCCSLPVPRSADTKLWGSAGVANRMRALLRWVAAVVQVQLTWAGSPGARCSKLFHDRAW